MRAVSVRERLLRDAGNHKNFRLKLLLDVRENQISARRCESNQRIHEEAVMRFE